MQRMKTIITALLLLIGISAMAQNKAYNVSKDSVDGGLIFNGRITFDDLNAEPSFTWLKKGVEAYMPDEKKIAALKEKFTQHNYSVVVFLGTWCDDSHELIPKLEKVLQLIQYPQSSLTMFGVDRAKTTTTHDEKQYKITLVPTIIVFDKDREIGRITESVQKSIEADLEAMLK